MKLTSLLQVVDDSLFFDLKSYYFVTFYVYIAMVDFVASVTQCPLHDILPVTPYG